MGHLLIENRSGLIVDAELTQATGYAERDCATEMLARLPKKKRRRTTQRPIFSALLDELKERVVFPAGHANPESPREPRAAHPSPAFADGYVGRAIRLIQPEPAHRAVGEKRNRRPSLRNDLGRQGKGEVGEL